MAPIAVSMVHEEPSVGVVGLSGEHDAYSAHRLEGELDVLLDEPVSVVVDLSDCTFVDSQTLSVLLGARHRAERGGLGFALVLPASTYTQVHRILDLTGLGNAFAMSRTLAEGLAVARAGRSVGRGLRVA